MLAIFVGQNFVMAQATLLPKAAEKDCSKLIATFNEYGPNGELVEIMGEILGCAIVTGRVSVPMIPYFIVYFSNYLLGLVSIIALLFVVIGGFLYTLGGLSQQKEKGKTFIMNALIGMVIAFLAWTIVNVIISALTG